MMRVTEKHISAIYGIVNLRISLSLSATDSTVDHNRHLINH